MEQPYAYHRDNVAKSLELFDELVRLGKPRVIFSSSASVYGSSATFEVSEHSTLGPSSPYARTKLVVEWALQDMVHATELRAVILRYFNPVGSDPELRSGVHARDPSHVLGQLIRTARGGQDTFTITGTDLPTRDGTGLRDYVHVWDVARAHVAAVEQFDSVLDSAGEGSVVLNVGTGQGVTVRELVAAVEGVCGVELEVREAPMRPGDVAGAYANVEKIRDLLGWSAERSLTEAIGSALAWADKRAQILGYE